MPPYASYPPPRQHYGHPYPGPYGPPPPRNFGPDHMASSPPQGFHPPLHRYPPPSGRNLTAVTPESGQMMPADFMSPPSNMKRRTLTPGSSLSPSKKARTGAFIFNRSLLGGYHFFRGTSYAALVRGRVS
jgi:hypothetical protein